MGPPATHAERYLCLCGGGGYGGSQEQGPRHPGCVSRAGNGRPSVMWEPGSPERLSVASLSQPARPGAGGTKPLGLCGSRTRVTLAIGGRDFNRG